MVYWICLPLFFIIVFMMMEKYCSVHKLAWALVWVGALNWGLVGAFRFNLVNAILGSWPTVERFVYILVGLSALMMLLASKCKTCQVPVEAKKM